MTRSAILSGKRIVITRAAGQGEELKRKLTNQYAAQVMDLPCVDFREPPDSAPLDRAIRSFASFDWILFTSRNAARFLARRCRALGIDPAQLATPAPRIGAIGPATAEAAAEEGFAVDFAPAAGTGRNFANMLKEHVRSVAGLESKNSAVDFVHSATGMKFLVPRSDFAMRDPGAADWVEILRDAGAEVTEVVAYCTAMPESLVADVETIRREGAECFVFSSPSAFHNFAAAFGTEPLRHLVAQAPFAAIGPTTAQAIRSAGFPCAIESPKPSAESLAAAIARYFETVLPKAKNEGAKHA